MKLFTTPALTCDDEEIAFVAQPVFDPRGYHFEWWFCTNGVFRLFDLPYTTKTIWLEFHDRPEEDRVSYQMKVEHLPNNDSLVEIDGSIVTMSGCTARSIEERLGSDRRLCYVDCYYKD